VDTIAPLITIAAPLSPELLPAVVVGAAVGVVILAFFLLGGYRK
jgi:hypothetical protein